MSSAHMSVLRQIWLVLVYLAVILTLAIIATALQPGGPF